MWPLLVGDACVELLLLCRESLLECPVLRARLDSVMENMYMYYAFCPFTCVVVSLIRLCVQFFDVLYDILVCCVQSVCLKLCT